MAKKSKLWRVIPEESIRHIFSKNCDCEGGSDIELVSTRSIFDNGPPCCPDCGSNYEYDNTEMLSEKDRGPIRFEDGTYKLGVISVTIECGGAHIIVEDSYNQRVYYSAWKCCGCDEWVDTEDILEPNAVRSGEIYCRDCRGREDEK